jgi:hypothetical protein
MEANMPLPENLTDRLVGMQFAFDGRALFVRIGSGDMVMASRACDLVSNGAVSLTAGDRGVWIPYRAQVATYGLLGGFSWAASGPFSGCELAIGQAGGEVYVAHISIERNRYEARDAFAQWIRHAPAPVYRSRIRAAEATGNYACYVFVSVDPELEIVRMDVTTRTIGGSDGTITNIERLDVTDQSPARSAPRRSRSPGCRCIIM